MSQTAQVVRLHELYRLVACTGTKYEQLDAGM